MNSIELDALFRADGAILIKYKGVFALDQIPDISKPNSLFVINLDPSDEVGLWFTTEVSK